MLLAAGAGTRVGAEVNKVFLPLAGRRVFTWSLRWASTLPAISRSLLVVAEGDRDLARAILAREAAGIDVQLVTGGDSRHASEWQAMLALAPEIEAGDLDVVVIHDAARPLAASETFAEVIAMAALHGGALPVRPQPSLVPLEATDDLELTGVVAVQTPQAFRAADLLAAYRAANSEGFVGTDTASCVERFCDLTVRCVNGSATNIKITFPEDLFLAEHLLAQAQWDLSGQKGGLR